MSLTSQSFTYWFIAIGAIIFSCQGPRSEPNATSNQSKSAPTDLSLLDLIASAEAQYDRQAYAYAATLYEEAVARDSQNVSLRHAWADALLDGLQSRRALEVMEETAAIFADTLRTQLKLAEYQLILKRYADANITIQRILAMQPSNADAFLLQGILHREQGDTLAAFRSFQNATREDPMTLDAWINAGQMAASLQGEQPLIHFDAGLRVDETHLPLWRAKAQYLASQDEFDNAISAYRSILKLDTDHSQTYFDLGLLYLDLDSIHKSLDHFNMAVQTEPLFSRAYFYRGATNELLGQLEQALADYQQSYKLDPADADAEAGIKRLSQSSLQ